MKPAPLQLIDYYITSLSLDANPRFEPEKGFALDLDNIHVTHGVVLVEEEDAEEEGTQWQVSLSIEQKIPDGENIPYTFKIDLQGLVLASAHLKDAVLDRAIRANGPAILFGAAREIIRAATGRGPWPSVIIPSTNFLSPPARKVAKVAKKAPAKKAARKTTRKRAR